MSKPRVLLVMHELTMAGATRLALSVFRELGDEIDLRMVANRPGTLRNDFADLGHLTVLRDGWAPRTTRKVLGTRDAQELIEGVHGRLRSRVLQPGWQGLRPDVVYLNSVAALPVYARMPWVRRIGCPTILHVHELEVMLGEFERIAPGMIATVPTKYVAVSEAVRQALESLFSVPREQIVVIPAHIDKHWTEDGVPVLRSLGPDETFVVGGFGIPSWMKGVELWLLTASELVRTQARERFRFKWFGLGDDAFARQFRAMVDKLDLGDVVELVGFMQDPKPAYRSIDLLLASSWEESASLVTLEAMATGRPVACFRGSGGPAEEVADTGIVIDEFSPAAMAAAIADLAGSPERMRALSQAAYERAASQYTSDGRAEQILTVVREVTET